MSTIFSKIINREIPGQFIYEDEVCVVLLDKFPAITGQVLVIPKKEMDYIFDLDEETYSHLFTVAKKVGSALDKTYDTTRTCLVVEGFEVPHVHIKLYPMTKDDTSLDQTLKEAKEASDEVLELESEKIKVHL